MTTVYDVPAEPLIENAASELRENDAFEPPAWARFVRTGAHKERPPESDDWWSVRAAAVLRKVYMHGPIGTERLAGAFGGARDRGVKPEKAVKGSRNVTRTILQQLEEAGLVKTNQQRGGRETTPQGQKLLDDVAHQVKQDLVDDIPELSKY